MFARNSLANGNVEGFGTSRVSDHRSQGLVGGGVSNGGGFPVWVCLFFFVFFPRSLSEIFADSGFSAYSKHLQGTFPKGSATQSGPFPRKVGTPPVGNPPVYLLSMKGK